MTIAHLLGDFSDPSTAQTPQDTPNEEVPVGYDQGFADGWRDARAEYQDRYTEQSAAMDNAINALLQERDRTLQTGMTRIGDFVEDIVVGLCSNLSDSVLPGLVLNCIRSQAVNVPVSHIQVQVSSADFRLLQDVFREFDPPPTVVEKNHLRRGEAEITCPDVLQVVDAQAAMKEVENICLAFLREKIKGAYSDD